MRTYVRVTGRDPHRGAPARRRRAQRLRDLPAARRRPHHDPRLAQARATSARHRSPCPRCGQRSTQAHRHRAGGLRRAARAVPRRRPHLAARAGATAPALPRRRATAIVRRVRRAAPALFAGHHVRRVLFRRRPTVVLLVYSTHLTCLFPQHGAGQEARAPDPSRGLAAALVDEAPWSFLRGCIRSDGCAFVNRTGRYEYLSYDFTNLSTDILDAVRADLHAVGLRPRRYARRSGSTAARTSPDSSSMSASRAEPRRDKLCAVLRLWRN